MARTPLLRSLKQLAAEHRLAAWKGLPVDALREQRAAPREQRLGNMSRRGFLIGSAAALASLAAPRVARGHGAPRIAIVGAGIAGLSAALTLADAGIPSTLYEASERVGGRMFSNTTYFDQGQVFEWYGELIDTGHVTLHSLARRFGLELDDLFEAQPRHSEETFYFFGKYYPKADADRDFRAIQKVLAEDLRLAGYPTTFAQSTPHGRMLDSMSVYDWIESRVPGGHSSPLGALLDTAYFIELNADTREQSALNLVYLLGYQPNAARLSMFGESDERYRIRGGNDQIPRAIAAHLGADTIQTGMWMEAISRTPAGAYVLTFSSRGARVTQVVADIVLLTLPFAVLRELDYGHAGFDPLKHRVIQELGRGRQSKQHLQFTRRLWNEQGPRPEPGTGGSYADTGYQATWEASRGQPGNHGILVGYAGGAYADAMRTRVAVATSTLASVRADAQRFLAQAEPVFPGLTRLWNGKATMGLPQLDPNFKCSYSYWRRGQCQTLAGYEGVTQGNVFFAGEHTSIDFQGFMEGGASEGVRAAQEILATLRAAPRWSSRQ
ncbi:NAD(P)/FAD-dependent oxidoreductase [Archangium sp.]|uniref:flavin monoamine oxidase family protein n=1 Tax=Archangium sp. TaxID=1872627 RepID=UPI002D4BF87D|nr:NAD(P)/FAD-dependent oxidoreductase [Archangium sp.]HYO51477.1 NAD(P)/FAD-dependent oxidoreductase [Archangium sp.]